jgi:5-methylcytosine-specific restriction protein A
MPQALAKLCGVLGCPHVQPCPDHGRKAQQRAYDDRRGSASSRGYGSRWRAYVEWFVAELFRLAVDRAGLCGARLPGTPDTLDSRCAAAGFIVVGTVVDHIVPVTGPQDARFYEPSNHQLLCESCHNAKRQRERGRVAST